jgi:hypothetical protein
MEQINDLFYDALSSQTIQDVPGGKVNILRGHNIGHPKQKIVLVFVRVSYFERYPRYSYFTVQFQNC